MFRTIAVLLLIIAIAAGVLYYMNERGVSFGGSQTTESGIRVPTDILQSDPAEEVDADTDTTIEDGSEAEPMATELPTEPPEATPEPSQPIANTSGLPFPQTLSLCPRMTISNRPGANEELVVTDYSQLVVVEGRVTLATAPIEAGCFSSGFGPRNGSQHKGVDYHFEDPVDVYAGAGGVIREKLYRDDYGNMLVIDHGRGVFTRYAHLQSFDGAMATGATVTMGQRLGVMGNTASYTIPRHLHYEVLTGQWADQAGSFALTPINVMSLPAAN